MEIVNSYWNLIKLKPMICIVVYGFAAPFLPILCTAVMAFLLIVPGGLSMYIWSITSMPGSIKLEGEASHVP